jgi:hypothetical protein
MQTVIVNGWQLVVKRTIGRRGYVFKTQNADFGGLLADSVTLTVNVVEEGAQRIFVRRLDPVEYATEAPGSVWEGFALITPVENEQLNELTKEWAPGMTPSKEYAIQFQLVSLDEIARVVFGILPKVSPAAQYSSTAY